MASLIEKQVEEFVVLLDKHHELVKETVDEMKACLREWSQPSPEYWCEYQVTDEGVRPDDDHWQKEHPDSSWVGKAFFSEPERKWMWRRYCTENGCGLPELYRFWPIEGADLNKAVYGLFGTAKGDDA